MKGNNLELEVIKKDGTSILKITGDVDLYSSPQVRKEVVSLISKTNKNLLVDLAEVTYMDSSGVATLVEALQLTKKLGGKLRIFSLGNTVKDVFELSRLDKVFEICDNEQQAFEGI
jgi:anti-sigma B factor antagonist